MEFKGVKSEADAVRPRVDIETEWNLKALNQKLMQLDQE